jgi:nitroimidazol reductase NimA-like FMN-containing flavoprotein (pyridoxamine 5'-phosphate oxidase superfamily)
MCVTVTLVDALVFARAARNHSMNYRSVVAFGNGTTLHAYEDKVRALEIIVDHVAPGRWSTTRFPSEAELRETTVISMPIDEASAKIRTGPPLDNEADTDTVAWAGIVPLRTQHGEPEPAHFCPPDATIIGLQREL